MSSRLKGISERLKRWGTVAENSALVILLTAMMTLAVVQIFMGMFFVGFVWADELVKLIVFWIAMIASIAAARSNRHLRIDILSHFVPEKFRRVPSLIVEAFAAFMCGLLAWHSYRYVTLVAIDETVLIDIPKWIAHGILPLAFVLMAYRFFLSFVAELVALIRGETAEADPR